MEIIRILLVEDQTLMRQGLRTILDLEPGLKVVGEAGDAEMGIRLALELRPDIILMDVQLPGASGVEATAAIFPLIDLKTLVGDFVVGLVQGVVGEGRTQTDDEGGGGVA